jgi:RES domain
MASADELAPPSEPLEGELPITTTAADSRWWRIHRTRQPPVFFGPAPGQPPTYRFDAPGGEYRILYLGQSLSAAFVETVLRNPRIPFIERSELEERSVAMLTNRHPLKLVDLRGGGLSQIGVDNRLTTGPYEVAGRWALALWRHPDSPDGILYRSKHDPNHICAAIFGRGHCEFAVTTTRPLMDIPHHWAPILGAHGKGIA